MKTTRIRPSAEGTVLDVKYDTLAEADAAAGAEGKTLVISKVWTVHPATISAETEIIFGGGVTVTGSIQFNAYLVHGGVLNGSGNIVISGNIFVNGGVFSGSGTVTGLKYANPTWFGSVGDGVANDTTAIQTALSSGAKHVHIPAGTYMVNALTVGAGILVTGDGYATCLKKRQNGDMITIGMTSTLENIYLEGHGATYTGRGIVVSTGDLDNVSWRKFNDVHILNMESYCIEYSASRAGYSSQMRGLRMTLANNNYTIGCVKFPDNEYSTLNGNRFMSDCWTFGNRIFDAAGCDNLVVTNCQGLAPLLGANSLKVCMSNCRIVGNGTVTSWTIDGTFTCITNCNIAGLNITFASTLANGKWVNNNAASAVITDSTTNNVTNGNYLYYDAQFVVPTWTGTGTPAIGNGTLTQSYTRKGIELCLKHTVLMGSTSTYGGGSWTFSLPKASTRPAVGSVYIINNAGVAVWSGVVFVDSGASGFKVVTSQSSAAFVGTSNPFTWASGDKMYVSLDYQI